MCSALRGRNSCKLPWCFSQFGDSWGTNSCYLTEAGEKYMCVSIGGYPTIYTYVYIYILYIHIHGIVWHSSWFLKLKKYAPCTNHDLQRSPQVHHICWLNAIESQLLLVKSDGFACSFPMFHRVFTSCLWTTGHQGLGAPAAGVADDLSIKRTLECDRPWLVDDHHQLVRGFKNYGNVIGNIMIMDLLKHRLVRGFFGELITGGWMRISGTNLRSCW